MPFDVMNSAELKTAEGAGEDWLVGSGMDLSAGASWRETPVEIGDLGER